MPEQSLIKEKPIRAWSGTKEDLLRLGEVLDAQFATHRVSAATCANVPQVPNFWPRWFLPKRRDKRAEAIRRLADGWSVILEVADSENRLTKDEYKRLLQSDGVGLNDAVSLTLSCTVEQQSCTIRLTDRNPGSLYRVQGDPAWAREAFATLQAEIRSAAPSWSFMRHPLGIVALLAVALALFFAGIVVEDDRYWWPLFIGAYVIPFCLWIGVNMLFPRFELREPSKKTRRQTILRGVAAVVTVLVTGLTIAGGVKGLLGD